MPRTPDRFPGTRYEEESIILGEHPEGVPGLPSQGEGDLRYVDGDFVLKDSLGAFNPRYGELPPATAPGQLFMSLNNTTFSIVLPVVSPDDGWLANCDGELLVEGLDP